MPTRHKRVSVTLTPPLREARERLRQRGLAPSVGELAIAGARALLEDADADREQRRKEALLRKRLADRIRTRSLPYDVDVAAAAEVKRLGLSSKHG